MLTIKKLEPRSRFHRNGSGSVSALFRRFVDFHALALSDRNHKDDKPIIFDGIDEPVAETSPA